MNCDKRPFQSKRAVRMAHRSAPWRIKAHYCRECSAWHAANGEKA